MGVFKVIDREFDEWGEPVRSALPQDADRPRTFTAGAVSPPFTSRDLYGTGDGRLLSITHGAGDGRLLSITTTLADLAKRFRSVGETAQADQCDRHAAHYAELYEISGAAGLRQCARRRSASSARRNSNTYG